MGRNAYCMRFRPVPSEGESFMASKQKILIVDDDNNIAELISLYLTKECYDTKNVSVYDPVTSETTTMAIADAQEYFEAYDCAFFAWIK